MVSTLQTKEGETRRRNPGALRLGKQTKFQEVFGRITDLAHERGPGAKLPTVLELRDRLGVSIATLNSVLGELEAQRIVLRRHGVGIYVAAGIGHHNIALVCDPSFLRHSGTSPFWSLLIEQLRLRAEAEHERVTFHFGTDISHRADAYPENIAAGQYPPGLGEHLVEEIGNGRVDGVIGIGLPLISSVWIEEKAPFVAFAGPGTYTFGLDADAIARCAVKYLVGCGCLRIAHWSPVAPYRYVTVLTETGGVRAFRRAMAEEGLAVDPELLWDDQHLIPAGGGSHTVTHAEQGYYAAMEVFGAHTNHADWPDAIFSSDDMLTQGALTALQRLGVAVGTDVQIVTHANAGSPALIGWEDRIARVEVDPAQLVSHLFDTLERLMRGEAVAKAPVLIPPCLRLPGDPRGD